MNVGTETDEMNVQPQHYLSSSRIEIIRDCRPAEPPEYVLFDFDGTLSLIREGWPSVMIPMMVEILQQTGTEETPEELFRVVETYVQRLNGKQTIYQMIQLVEEVRKRGGTPEDPRRYKEIYHDRLMEKISSRREALRRGEVSADEMMVPGAGGFLEALRDRRLRLYLASGTDEKYVLEEAGLLGLDHFFEDRIYGAVDRYQTFSKKQVIERILLENRVPGNRLVGIGDGYVEIENVKTAGGIAVAVASDEAGRSGLPDPWKRRRLIGVGADIVIPDFREYPVLIEYLFEKSEPGR